MLRNYIKIAFRNLTRNKLFSLINIFGLSISIACCLLLFLFANQELNYDQHHGKEIYRLTSSLSQKDGQLFRIPSSSVPIAPQAAQDIPEIVQYARLTSSMFFGSKDMVAFEANSFYVENGIVADSTIMDIFNFAILVGDQSNPMPHNEAVVIEKDLAAKLFGEINDALGKTIKIATGLGEADYEITAVYDKDVSTSHLSPSYIVSMGHPTWAQFMNRFSSQWVGNNLVLTYFELTPGAEPEEVNEKIRTIFLSHGQEEMAAMGMDKTMEMQPVQEIHTATDYDMDFGGGTDLTFLRILVSIGILILVLACVNYINLSTAQAGRRSLEVGVRKVMGVTSRGLIGQFLGESFVIVAISVALSLVIAFLALPFFNQLIENPININSQLIQTTLIYSAGFVLITALVAGLYPAFYLSRFKPVKVLKGKSKDQASTVLIRKVLVVLQFVISIVLISAILIISKQVDFLETKDLGFSKESKLIVPLSTAQSNSQYSVLRQKFEQHSLVKGVTGSQFLPGSPITNDILLYKDGQTMEDAIHIYNNYVDINYMDLLGMKMMAGGYPTEYNQDTTIAKVIINKKATLELGLTPLGALNNYLYFDWQGETHKFLVVGVVEDINQFSLHEEIESMVFQLGREDADYSYMVVDANLTNYQSFVIEMEKEWKAILPDVPFEYYSLDEHLNRQYAGDYNTFNLIKYFAFISVVISCLGLYALSMFVAESRFKEIGVRKALGATATDVLILVSKDLSLLILIAFAISIPLSIYGMNQWLESFAYRITPGVGIYVLAGVISIFIGWLTISYQSLRAARTNPVNVLVDE